MTPSPATAATARREPATRQQSSARRPAARRPQGRGSRRRGRARARLLALAGVGLLAVVFIAVLPSMRQAVRDFTLPLRYSDVIREQAADKHLDPAFVAGVIYAETKFVPRTSPAGALGLMQIEPRTAEFLAHRSGGTAFTVADLATPRVNIAYGCYYLRYLLDEYHGSTLAALAAYNGGETNVNGWVAAAHAAGHAFALSDIPFPETRDYVNKVLGAQRRYRTTYPTELGYR